MYSRVARETRSAVGTVPKLTGLRQHMDEPFLESVKFWTYFFRKVRTCIARRLTRTQPFSQQGILDELVSFDLVREKMCCQVGRNSVGSRLFYRGSDYRRLS